MKINLNNKSIMITGGTGSFGNAVLNTLLSNKVNEIRIFSRDEKKQDDMRAKFQNDRIKFYIGDVRDYQSVLDATRDVNFIFHAAALKQVPSCEFYPLEAVKTNIIGTSNIVDVAVENNIKKNYLPQHRQGSISYKCNGSFKSYDGKSNHSKGQTNDANSYSDYPVW